MGCGCFYPSCVCAGAAAPAVSAAQLLQLRLFGRLLLLSPLPVTFRSRHRSSAPFDVTHSTTPAVRLSRQRLPPRDRPPHAPPLREQPSLAIPTAPVGGPRRNAKLLPLPLLLQRA